MKFKTLFYRQVTSEVVITIVIEAWSLKGVDRCVLIDF